MKSLHALCVGRAKQWAVFAAILLPAAARPALADVVNISVTREVYTQSEINGSQNLLGPIISTNAGVFAPGNQVATAAFGGDSVSASVDQNTNVPASGTTFSGTGSASDSVSIVDPDNTGSVYFGPDQTSPNFPISGETLLFTLTTPYIYTATGTLSSVVDPSIDGVFATSIAELVGYGSGPTVFVDENAFVNSAGTLLPGTYELVLSAYVGDELPFTAATSGTASASWDLTLQLTPATVPEPGSLTLLCLGLAGFGGIGWLRRRNSRIVSRGSTVKGPR